jgi:hypothetical protein
LSNIQADLPVKIVGQTSAGVPTTPVGSDPLGALYVAGLGVAGTPVGGVLSVQGVAGGTALPASQSGTWIVQPGNTANTTPWLVTDSSDGPVIPGAVAGKSSLVGGQYNTVLPTLSNTQQSALQVDSSARLIISPLTNASVVKSQLQDNAGNGITSTLINSKQRLDVDLPSEGAAGSANPFYSLQVGGTDGTNLRTMLTDSVGRVKLSGYGYFHPSFTLRIQAVPANTGALATSLVIPISSTSSGSMIAVAVSSSVAGTVTVTDNLSQTYSTAISGTSGTHVSYIFYKANTAAGVTSIIISSTSSSGICAVVTEYRGISATPLDKTSTGTTTGTTAFSSGSTAVTTSAVELLLGTAHGVTKNNLTYTAGTGWTSVSTSNGFNAGAGQLYMEDQYVTVTGTYAATGTASANDTIVADIATFAITDQNLISVNQPRVVKSGSGILKKVVVNSVGTGSPTLTLYDSTTNNPATVIAVLSLSGAVGEVDYNLAFATGLTIIVNSTTADFTLVYE